MEDKPLCVCSININEGQSLREGGFHVDGILDYLSNFEFVYNNNPKRVKKITSWDSSCDSRSLRNAVELLGTFFNKSFMKDNFYFVFSEVVAKTQNDKSNCNSNLLSKSSFCASLSEYNANSIKHEEYGGVFGSPLKLEPIADISLNDTSSDCMSTSTIINDQYTYTSHLVGLSVSEARKILSKFCQIRHAEQKQPLLKSMVILCDCSGDSVTNKNIILLGVHNDVDGEKRKLTTFKVTCSNKKHSLAFLEPLDLVSDSICPMQCTYSLLEQQDKARKLKIEAYWSNCRGNSIISNLHTAQFNLRITAPFGYRESPLFKYLRQLKHVMMLCKGLRKGELPNVLTTSPYNVQEHLQNLFMRTKDGLQGQKSPMSGGEKGKKIKLVSTYSADICDELWEVFAQCEVYQDMILGLKMVFNVLKKNEFPLFVSNDNDTLLAKLVRQSSSGLTFFPPLTNLTPLRIISELGLEHMKKTYISILLKNELSVQKDIDNFLEDSQREDTGGNQSVSVVEPDHLMEDSLLETVMKLHHCIDLVCLVDLQTENLQLKPVAAHILNYYRSNALEDSYNFVIPLDSRAASQEVERLTPCMVRREYKVGDHSRVECLVSELPEELNLQPVQQPPASDISMSTNYASTECFKITTEETFMILGCL